MKEADILKTKYAKELVKNKCIHWLKENGIDISNRKMRVYEHRGVPELRIYQEPTTFTNSRKSRRMMEEPDVDGNNCTYGIHSRTILLYIHINLADIERAEKDPEEKEFILMQFQDYHLPPNP